MGIRLIFRFYSVVLFFLAVGCKNNIANNEVSSSFTTNKKVDVVQVDEAKEIIKQFYLTYYKGENNGQDNYSVLKKFVTNRLLQRIQELRSSDNLILNYDPFIKAQDYSSEIIKNTIKVNSVFNKENEYEVSFNLFELENEKPTKVVLYLFKKGDIYLIDAINNDKYLNLEQIKENSSSEGSSKIEKGKSKSTFLSDKSSYDLNDYIGSYFYFHDMGKLDEIASMTIGYSLNIREDSIFFSGQGYKTNFEDLCTAKINKGVLEMYYEKSITGYDYNKNGTQPIIRISRKGDDFYASSPLIEDGKKIKLEKEK